MNEFNYEDWLAGHATRKNMMEKLERSLIPFELFALIPLKNDRQNRNGMVAYGENTYFYRANYDYSKFGNDIYDVNINVTHLEDRWNNLLPGYNRFKVVMRDDAIVTIYAYHEDFFQDVIGMFEREDMKGLYAHRSAYVNNLLTRYILLRLIERKMPDKQLLGSLKSEKFGNVSFMAANANRTELIMYAFNKRDAIEMAIRFEGISRHLTIIYFLNQDFEHDGNELSYCSYNTEVISVRIFYARLCLSNNELREVEQKVLMIATLLYDEQLEWNHDAISRVALNPPTRLSVKSLILSSKKRQRRKTRTEITPWWSKFSRALLEDALNVIEKTPESTLDIFHSLCAANMVNAYINHCNRHGMFSHRQLGRMFRAKQQMLSIVLSLISNSNVYVRFNQEGDPGVYVHIKVNRKDYQFSFRGFDIHQLRLLRNSNLQPGNYNGISLQAIATPLYQYAYLQRWKRLKEKNETK